MIQGYRLAGKGFPPNKLPAIYQDRVSVANGGLIVRFWHKADITSVLIHVRLWGFNGQRPLDVTVMPGFVE